MPTPREKIAADIARGVEEFNLTPMQAKLALRYVLDRDTAGKKTQSGLATYSTESNDVAYHMAHATLRKPHVRTYVQHLLDEAGFGTEVRSGRLARIGMGKLQTKKELVHKNKNGEVVSTQEIISDVPASVQLKAIAEANKVEGRYEQASAEIRIVEREYSTLRKKLMKGAGLAVSTKSG